MVRFRHKSIGPHDDFRTAAEINDILCFEGFRGAGSFDESDPSLQCCATRVQVFGETAQVAGHDQLSPNAEGHFQQSGVFQRDVEQVADTVDDLIPRRGADGPCPVKHLADPESKPFLPLFQALEDVQPCIPGDPLFAHRGHRVFAVPLFLDQSEPLGVQPIDNPDLMLKALGGLFHRRPPKPELCLGVLDRVGKIAHSILDANQRLLQIDTLCGQDGRAVLSICRLFQELVTPVAARHDHLSGCGGIGLQPLRLGIARIQMPLLLGERLLQFGDPSRRGFEFGRDGTRTDAQIATLLAKLADLRVHLALPRRLVPDGRVAGRNLLAIG
jgi:hypothetical protein